MRGGFVFEIGADNSQARLLLVGRVMIPAFVNPAAGNADDVERALTKAGCFDIRPVAPDQITQAVQNAIEKGATRIAAVGGDGTISAAAAALARTDVELVVIPGGTFNHFARDHGIPTELEQACELATSGRVIGADVAWVNGRLFLSTSSVGVYANFVRVRERLEPRFGYWASSVLAMVRTFARVQPFHLRFESGGVQQPYQTPLVFIGIGERELKLPSLGKRVPGGRSGLHVMIVRGGTRARLVALAFDAAARGTSALSRTPHLDSFLVEQCTIEQRHSTVALDGEVVTVRSPLRFELGAGALKLVVPTESSVVSTI
jgi:diacylglycerol kinase family enzyme